MAWTQHCKPYCRQAAATAAKFPFAQEAEIEHVGFSETLVLVHDFFNVGRHGERDEKVIGTLLRHGRFEYARLIRIR